MSLRALTIGSTGIQSPAQALEVVANNLANLQTPGFKAARASFQDLVYQHSAGSSVGSGTGLATTSSKFDVGPLTSTGRELDLAINGPGFLSVVNANGESFYTRAGNLTLNAQGELTTPGGLRLDPPIQIPDGTSRIQISAEGKVFAESVGDRQEIGTINVVNFANPEGLAASGENRYVATSASGPAVVGQAGLTAGAIRQGYLESSNVDAVTEFTSMIQLQQAFQVNSQVIQYATDRLRMLRDLNAK
ncbi:flagellar hook basal-body protein [bacterium]|nr:flagellar hook basal-body protein [bacterium]